jgi:hypothetical protein
MECIWWPLSIFHLRFLLPFLGNETKLSTSLSGAVRHPCEVATPSLLHSETSHPSSFSRLPPPSHHQYPKLSPSSSLTSTAFSSTRYSSVVSPNFDLRLVPFPIVVPFRSLPLVPDRCKLLGLTKKVAHLRNDIMIKLSTGFDEGGTRQTQRRSNHSLYLAKG